MAPPPAVVPRLLLLLQLRWPRVERLREIACSPKYEQIRRLVLPHETTTYFHQRTPARLLCPFHWLPTSLLRPHADQPNGSSSPLHRRRSLPFLSTAPLLQLGNPAGLKLTVRRFDRRPTGPQWLRFASSRAQSYSKGRPCVEPVEGPCDRLLLLPYAS